MTHLALLRGINVGGHKKVPMADLRKAFSEMGFSNVQTLLASGNVLFEAEAADPDLEDGAEDREEGRGERVKINIKGI